MANRRGPTSKLTALTKILENYAGRILDNVARARATDLEEIQHERETSDIEKEMTGKWFHVGMDPGGVGGLWTGVRVLGTGGQGSAGLFLRLDDKNQIIDRIAVKEARLDDSDLFWEYGWRFPGTFPSRLTEAVIHAFLSRPMSTTTDDNCTRRTTGHPHGRTVSENPRKRKRPVGAGTVQRKKQVGQGAGFVNYRSSVVMGDPMIYRMYMDYADGGDLLHIIDLYGKKHEKVPEPYLWFTLYHLMIACKKMDNITIGRPGEVIHQDIKMNNVFLDKPNPLWFPQFPIPKMGDLGSAQFTFEGDSRNPVAWRGMDPMTPGWQPTEYRRPEIPTKLTSSVNVWQSAMIIRIFMQMQFSGFEYYEIDVPLMDKFNSEYSQELMDVISRCLSDKGDHRYKPQQVIDYIDDNFDKFFQGAEDPGVVSQGQHQVLGAINKDFYKLKIVYQGGPKDVPTATTRLDSPRYLVKAPEPDIYGPMLQAMHNLRLLSANG